MTAMVERASPYSIPADWFTSVQFDTLDRMPTIEIPVVVLRGGADRRIPDWMPEQVFERAREPKLLVTIADAGHGEIVERGLDAVLSSIVELASTAAPPGPR
jgi:alpha-beta hydrolase superfamily lysophospholipase